MRDFVFLIHDERRRQPSLMLVSTATGERARLVAARMLKESRHRTSVEVWEEGARLFTVGEPCDDPGMRPAQEG